MKFNRLKESVLITVLLLGSAAVQAQESELGNWYILFGNKKINDQWNIHAEVQYRNYNMIGDLEQLMLRTGVGYNLSPGNNNILLGYGHITSENYIGPDVTQRTQEHRIFQQFITKQHFDRFSLQHRYRFEERFVDQQAVKYRLRYFLSLNVALTNRALDDKTFYLSAYNELFIHVANSANHFDRNRLYGGLGYKLNEKFKFEFGYMNQFFENGQRDQLNVVTFVSL